MAESRCCLGYGLRWAQGAVCQVLAPDPSGKGQFFWGGIHVKTHPVIKCGDWGESTVENRLT